MYIFPQHSENECCYNWLYQLTERLPLLSKTSQAESVWSDTAGFAMAAGVTGSEMSASLGHQVPCKIQRICLGTFGLWHCGHTCKTKRCVSGILDFSFVLEIQQESMFSKIWKLGVTAPKLWGSLYIDFNGFWFRSYIPVWKCKCWTGISYKNTPLNCSSLCSILIDFAFPKRESFHLSAL